MGRFEAAGCAASMSVAERPGQAEKAPDGGRTPSRQWTDAAFCSSIPEISPIDPAGATGRGKCGIERFSPGPDRAVG
ncbi:MAG: hypothetical protein ACOY5U_10055 [Pseudomonadota bacterium]